VGQPKAGRERNSELELPHCLACDLSHCPNGNTRHSQALRLPATQASLHGRISATDDLVCSGHLEFGRVTCRLCEWSGETGYRTWDEEKAEVEEHSQAADPRGAAPRRDEITTSSSSLGFLHVFYPVYTPPNLSRYERCDTHQCTPMRLLDRQSCDGAIAVTPSSELLAPASGLMDPCAVDHLRPSISEPKPPALRDVSVR